MYPQMVIHPKQHKLQKILFRDNQRDKIKIYQMQSLTFGFAQAPFQTTRSLDYVADEFLGHKQERRIIKNNFYVDDLLFSCTNMDN
jgi:hypothetical protein